MVCVGGEGYLALPLSEADKIITRLRSSPGAIAGPPVRVERLDARLYPYQVEGVKFLAARRSALLADEMGLGKTPQAVVAAEVVRRGGAVLVVCPAGLTEHWRSEIAKWAGARATVASPGVGQSTWTIVSIDTAKASPVGIELQELEWKVAIFDEAQKIKNPLSKRSEWFLKVRSEYTWLLTGTPMANRPRDLLGLLEAADHPLGSDRDEFNRIYDIPDEEAATRSRRLGIELAPWMLRRERRDVQALPERRRHTRIADSGDYGDLKIMAARARIALDKAEATAQLADELVDAGRCPLVFSGYIEALDRIAACAEAQGHRVARLDGRTAVGKRAGIVKRFAAGDYDMLVAQIAVGGVGYDFTSSSAVVFNDLSYVPSEHAQAEARAYRHGQESEIDVHYVVSKVLLDRTIWRLLEVKIENIRAFESASITDREVEAAMRLPQFEDGEMIRPPSGGIVWQWDFKV